jgi:zinc transporter ZupT
MTLGRVKGLGRHFQIALGATSMLRIMSVAAVLLAVFGASLAVERLLHRSRKEFKKPAWYAMFFLLFAPAVYVVYARVPVDNEFLYAAYAAAGGLAALVAQVCFGVPLSGEIASKDGDDA